MCLATPPETSRTRWKSPLNAVLFLLLLTIAAFTAFQACALASNHRNLFNPEARLTSSALTPRMIGILGTTHYTEGFADGLPLMRQAWELSPDPMLANNLGAAFIAQHKLPQAEAVYSLWADSGLVHSQALHNLSIVQENLGNYPAADTTYATIQNLWPDTSAWVIPRRVNLAMRTGQPQKVLELALPYLPSQEIDGPTFPTRIRCSGNAAAPAPTLRIAVLPIPANRTVTLMLPHHRDVRYLAATARGNHSSTPLDFSSCFDRIATAIPNQPQPARPAFDNTEYFLPCLPSPTLLVSLPEPDDSPVRFEVPLLTRPITNNCCGPCTLTLPPGTHSLYILGCAINADTPLRLSATLTDATSSLPIPLQFSDWCRPADTTMEPVSAADQLHLLNFTAAAYMMLNHPEQARPLLQTVLDRQPENTMAQRNMTVLQARPQ